jgi:hypothetical protein
MLTPGAPGVEIPFSNSLVVTGPGPPRNLAQWMKLIIALGMGILHRDFRAEFNVRPDGFTEILVVGKTRRVESCQVELDKPLSLLLGDPKISVHIDEMAEAEIPGEAVGTTEGLGREGSEVIDMLRLAGPEEWLK